MRELVELSIRVKCMKEAVSPKKRSVAGLSVKDEHVGRAGSWA